jgi:hypothetical protein
MGFLRKKKDEQPEVATIEGEPVVCEHVTLIPRWDSADDMGKQDRASMFRCESCGQEFNPAEATRLRATEAARVQRKLAS